MARSGSGESNLPRVSANTAVPASAGSAGPRRDAPEATNSWARRTILARATEIGLAPEQAKQVGSVALWYYNRIVLLYRKKDGPSQELPHDTNRYLVPITLVMACTSKKLPVELERVLRLSGTPTKRTIDTAQDLLSRYTKILAPPKKAAAPARAARTGAPTAAATPRPAAHPGFEVRSPPAPKSPSPSTARASAVRASSVSNAPPAPTTALAVAVSTEVLELRQLFPAPAPAVHAVKPGGRPRQQNTNAWARKRIADLCRTQGLPEPVRTRSLEFYERIVLLHSKKGGVPPGKRLQLSPRLNWSLAYTTIYLACRSEEYPRDLRDILGSNPHPGALREIYGLYRFYKRELRLTIKLVDVRTFILSWLDGFDISDLMHEKATDGENARVRNRAIAIANRLRLEKSLERTSTKIIAAGALTTALAERNPPGTRYAFYRAVADFLHMSEETIRLIVTRIAELM